jgi:hypothetical protein
MTRIGGSRRPATVAAADAMKVEATKLGYYGNRRRRVGDVFTIRRDEFAETWMVEVDASTPERSRSLHDIAKQAEIDTMTGRVPRLNPIGMNPMGRDDEGVQPTGDRDVLGGGDEK